MLILNAGFSMVWIRALRVSEAEGPNVPPRSLIKRYFQGASPTWEKLWAMRDELLSDVNTSRPGRTSVLIVFAHSTMALHAITYPSVMLCSLNTVAMELTTLITASIKSSWYT